MNSFWDKLKFNLNHLRRQNNPMRATLAVLIEKLGLSPLIQYTRNGVKIQLRTGGLARLLWEDPQRLLDGESFLKSVLRPGDVVVDVGANIGILSLLAWKSTGDLGRVIAIEPHPATYLALQQNLKLNHVHTVEALNIAVSSEPGSLRFSDWKHDEWNKVDNTSGTLEVEARCLEDVCSDLARIDLLKIDVEGFELSVLQGCSGLLYRTECILLECWSQHTTSYGYRPLDIINLLKRFSFHGYLLEERPDSFVLTPLPNSPCATDLENWVFVKNPSWIHERDQYAFTS